MRIERDPNEALHQFLPWWCRWACRWASGLVVVVAAAAQVNTIVVFLLVVLLHGLLHLKPELLREAVQLHEVFLSTNPLCRHSLLLLLLPYHSDGTTLLVSKEVFFLVLRTLLSRIPILSSKKDTKFLVLSSRFLALFFRQKGP